MKQHKLWKTGEDELCRSNSAIQTQPGPSSLLEERSVTPIVLLFSLCCRLPPVIRGNYLYTLAVSPSLGGNRQHKRNNKNNGNFTPFF